MGKPFKRMLLRNKRKLANQAEQEKVAKLAAEKAAKERTAVTLKCMNMRNH